jgi:drug/metabolite transporter (DMT)-like permease
MGLAFALASAASFALQSICVRIGHRSRRDDDGHFMSVLMNTLLVLVVLPFTTLYAWSWVAFAAFLLAGIGTTWLGRGTALRAIRLIGPARQGAFLISAPLFTGVAGWTLLDETPALNQLTGGILVLAGLGVLIRSKLAAEPLAGATLEAEEPVVEPAFAEPGAVAIPTRDAYRTRGYAIAFVGAAAFGLGYVMRAWGLEHYPNAVFGALVGAALTLVLIVVRESVRGRLATLWDENIRHVPLWFLVGGLLSGLGLIFGFSSFLYLPAWAVAVIKGTQGLWTLVFSYIFIRDEERLGPTVVLSVILTFSGIVVMALAT